MFKWWLRYICPILIIGGLCLIQLLFEYENSKGKCLFKKGKYKVIETAFLEHPRKLDQQLSFSARIKGRCLNSSKAILVSLFFNPKHAPKPRTKVIVHGRLYKGKSNIAKIYVKQWFYVTQPKVTLFKRISNKFNEKMRVLYPRDFALIQAAVFANKQYLSQDIKDLFNRLGIGHLLVVSGIHFALIVLFLNKLILKCLSRSLFIVQNTRLDILDLILSGGIGLIYLQIIAHPVSAQRAFCFIVLSKFLFACGIKASIFSIIFLSALVLYCVDPTQIHSLSFVYSFSCVLGIALFLQTKPKLYDSFKVTLGVFLFSQVLTGIFFSKITPFAWVTNIVAIPVFSLLLIVYCTISLLLLVLKEPLVYELIGKSVYHINSAFIDSLKYIDQLGAHQIDLKYDNAQIFFVLALLALILYQITLKIRDFYNKLHAEAVS